MAQKAVDAKVAERCAPIVGHGCRRKVAARAAGIESQRKAGKLVLVPPVAVPAFCDAASRKRRVGLELPARLGAAMDVELQYGADGLRVGGLPDARTTVVGPSHLPGVDDEYAVAREAIRRPVAGPPLRELLRAGQTVTISVCDGTRPQPREVVISAILDELDGIVRLEDVVVLVATGTHRANREEELRAMLGDEVVCGRTVRTDPS